MTSPIEKAIEIHGTGVSLAEAVDRSPQFISALRTGRRPIPAELCPDIERATNGRVRCEELRPDVSWGVLRQSS